VHHAQLGYRDSARRFCRDRRHPALADSGQLVALVRVDPQLHVSGQTAGQAKMSKRGSLYLRQAIWHTALTASRVDPRFQAIDER
jgi:transposase